MLPDEKASSSIEKIRLSHEQTVERALGIIWCIENDTLGFHVTLKDVPLTRRGILSSISSICDPLGIASPFLLKGKLILQQIVAEKKDWDEQLSEVQISNWGKWREGIKGLIKIQRCYKESKHDILESSLHSFSDASEVGYGTCTYLRQVDVNGNVSVALIMGRSRVAPLKIVTIPRLELMAADLSTRFAGVVKEVLNMKNHDSYFYADSKIVIGYIYNERLRFRTFVTNRVHNIRSTTIPRDWQYVSSSENPADVATRDINMNEQGRLKLWLYGPDELKKRFLEENVFEHIAVDANDPEIRKVKVLVTQTLSQFEDPLEDLYERLSSWSKIKRGVAVVVHVCQKRPMTKMQVEDVQRAGTIILMNQQKRFLADEIKGCKKKVSGSKSTRMDLDPFIDHDGLLKVGGRLNKAALDVPHNPYLLTKESIVSRRIVEHIHRTIQHEGEQLSEVRSAGCWIIGINAIVRKLIFNCVRCKFLRGFLCQQKMANLPKSRLVPEGPFTICGLDKFCPFTVKDRRKEMKRYVVLFTCMSSRAVHLESTREMTTDSFLNALRRFICRRGPVRSITSDNGSNFIDAQAELKQCFTEMDHGKIKKMLLEKNCDWITWAQSSSC